MNSNKNKLNSKISWLFNLEPNSTPDKNLTLFLNLAMNLRDQSNKSPQFFKVQYEDEQTITFFEDRRT